MTVRVRDAISPAEVARAVKAHPHLPGAIREIARRANLPEEVVSRHLNQSILEVLDVLGSHYVSEMGAAIARVDRLRDQVHGFYERVLSGQEPNPDVTALRDSFTRLQAAIKEISDPQEWAKKQAEARARDPLAGLMVPAGRPAAVAPAATVAPPPPRWTRRRTLRRVGALPVTLSEVARLALRNHPELLEAAAAGDTAALTALRTALRADGVPAHDLTALGKAVAALREPDLGYALGGTTVRRGRGPRGAAARAFDELPKLQRDAVRAAAELDPEFVRSMTTSEITYGDPHGRKSPWRPEEIDTFCQEHGITGPQREALEAGLRELNRAHRESLRQVPERGLATPIALERAQMLDDAAAGLGLPPTGKIAKALAKSQALREIAAASPEQLLQLASDWLELAEAKAAAGQRPPSFSRYVQGIMRTQVRGLVGEFTAVMRLGKDIWVLKMPDLKVTDPGTDFVVVVKASGELWFCDNKALSSAELSRVTSLVENIGQNMADDVRDMGQQIEQARLPVPTAVTDAIGRGRSAARLINSLLEGLSPEEIWDPGIQAEITRICDRHGVRRVVTNAGGELTMLSAALAGFGVDLANLEGASPQYPTRPLTPPRRRRGGSRGGTR
jgi:hypothetical protein